MIQLIMGGIFISVYDFIVKVIHFTHIISIRKMNIHKNDCTSKTLTRII